MNIYRLSVACTVTVGLISGCTSNHPKNVAPQYRGYAESEGTVQGLYGDAVDTENAIVAADSLSVVNNQSMWLEGVSMGGGVVLVVAPNPKYSINTNAVVAISPFVGWDITMKWANKNENNSQLADGFIQEGLDAYGTFNPNKKGYKQNSLDVANIGAPTLLLQGTGDKNVPWQATQILAFNVV